MTGAVSCVLYWSEADIRSDIDHANTEESERLSELLAAHPLLPDGRRIVVGVRKWSWEAMPGHPLDDAPSMFVHEWHLPIGDKWDLFGYRVN